jgi:hypothetical protein
LASAYINDVAIVEIDNAKKGDFMIRLALATVLVFAAIPAMAHDVRGNVQMSCSQARKMIAATGYLTVNEPGMGPVDIAANTIDYPGYGLWVTTTDTAACLAGKIDMSDLGHGKD